MKKIFIIFICIAVIGSNGCAKKNPDGIVANVTEDRDITIEKGRVLTIVLEANPTTGYSWDWKKEGDSKDSILALFGNPDYAQDSASKTRVGSGGQMRYSFRALEKGQVKLIYEYKRPWEKDEVPLKTYTVSVTVE